MSTLRFFAASICLSALAARLNAATPTPDYSALVEPIFTEHCLDCHGSTEPEGKLVMETFDLLMKGGESGAVIVPGKSDESLLVRMIEGKFEKDGKKKIMPPGKRDKLKPAQIALIKAWIDAGAKPPVDLKPKELVVPRIEPKVPPRKSISAIAYSPSKKLLALARYGEVELRSAETRAVVRTLKGHRGNVNAVAFSPDGRFLFAGGGDAGFASAKVRNNFVMRSPDAFAVLAAMREERGLLLFARRGDIHVSVGRKTQALAAGVHFEQIKLRPP